MISPKGYAFVTSSEGIDFFLHCTAVQESGLAWPLAAGERVSFSTRMNKKAKGNRIEAYDVEIMA